MTAIPQPGVSRGVPTPIHKTLRAVASRQWRLAASKGALQTLLVALAAVLAAALLLGFLPAAPTGSAFPSPPSRGRRPWPRRSTSSARRVRRRSLTDAAFVVERRLPGLDERLSSAVELSGEPDAFTGSPLLVRHLVRRAESDARPSALTRSLPADAVRKLRPVAHPPRAAVGRVSSRRRAACLRGSSACCCRGAPPAGDAGRHRGHPGRRDACRGRHA